MLELHEILRQLKREKYDFLNSLRAQFRYHIESKFCMVGSSFNCIVSARFALIQSYSSILFGCSDTQFSRNTSDKLGKSDDLVHQSATNTTTIYNTIVNVAEKGERSPDYGEQIGKSNLTERNLATTSLTEEGTFLNQIAQLPVTRMILVSWKSSSRIVQIQITHILVRCH